MTELPPELIIAVVDDDRRILEALGSLLESADFAVRLFDSATAMLESRCLDQIACLISDIDMPVMDGFELLRTVQACRPELSVVLITGQSSKLNQLVPSDLGHYPILKKPFNGQDLLTIIMDSLQKQAPRVSRP